MTSKDDVTRIIGQLNADLAQLIQDHDELLKPKCTSAQALLKNVSDKLKPSYQTFSEITDIYQDYAAIQAKESANSKETLTLARLKKEITEALPNLAKQLKTAEQSLRHDLCELKELIALMHPLVDDFNKRLKALSDSRPKGFFKPQAAAELKKEISAFCAEYKGKKGLLELINHSDDLLASFNRMKKFCLNIAQQVDQFNVLIDKKLTSFYGPSSSTLLSSQETEPKPRRGHGRELIEILETASSSTVNK